MIFRVPSSFATLDRLKKRAQPFKSLIKPRKNSKLKKYLEDADLGINREDYLAICISGFVFSFIFSVIFLSVFFILFKVENGLLYVFLLSLLFASFVFFSRVIYPKVYVNRKVREIEKNLIPALEDMIVQLNSGIPLFSILINISSSNYGALSEEFKKAVKKINAGIAEEDVLEELGEKNPSLFFRRTLWQISNSMKTGGDISIIIEENIKSLTQEQLIQIQNYGNKLNPIVMFYMLSSVIIPSLSITFLTILSSLLNLPAITTTLLFIGLFVFVVIIQIMFLGVVKSLRPSLL